MRKSWLIRLGLAALAAVAIALPASAGGRDGGDGSHGNSSPRLGHIFVIMLENHSQSSVIGDANAPFINSLAQQYATAANYFGVTHPSEPNYVAAISGSNWFINNDNPANRFDHTNLVDQFEASHRHVGRVHGVDAERRLSRRLRAGHDARCTRRSTTRSSSSTTSATIRRGWRT